MRKSVFKSYSMVIEMDLIRNCSIGKYDALARVRCMVFRKQHENWLMCPLFCISWASSHQSIKELRILKMHQDINLTIKASSKVRNARMLLTSSALGICRTFEICRRSPQRNAQIILLPMVFSSYWKIHCIKAHVLELLCMGCFSSIWLMRPFVSHLLGITASKYKGSGLFGTWRDTSALGICRRSLNSTKCANLLIILLPIGNVHCPGNPSIGNYIVSRHVFLNWDGLDFIRSMWM